MVDKKTPGILGKMKNAVVGMFSREPARKSPKGVEAGKKAAVTAKVNEATQATGKAVKKAAKAVAAPGRKSTGKAKKSAARKMR
jgi:hypothetical protein